MDCEKPYVHLKMGHIGLLHLGITILLVSISLVHIRDPTAFLPVNTFRGTLYAIDNYKVTAGGIKYFNYSDPETGEELHGELTDQWFEERLKGRYTYYFGLGYDNFCWPRTVPDSEWLPSLFRSGQLLPWVQVPLRAAILLGMTYRVFQAIVIGYMKVQLDPGCKLDGYLVRIFVANELVHNVFLFYVSNFLATPDMKYLYMMGPSIVIAYVTFSLKMWLSLWHTGIHFTTGIRLLLFAVTSLTVIPNYRNWLEYLDHNYCDPKVPPLQAINELATVSSLLVSEFLDVYQTQSLESVIGGSDLAIQHERRIRQEASQR